MVSSVWLVVTFLAGAATGALLVSLHRMSNLSRIREEFKAELEGLGATKQEPASEKAAPKTSDSHRVA